MSPLWAGPWGHSFSSLFLPLPLSSSVCYSPFILFLLPDRQGGNRSVLTEIVTVVIIVIIIIICNHHCCCCCLVAAEIMSHWALHYRISKYNCCEKFALFKWTKFRASPTMRESEVVASAADHMYHKMSGIL